jgi:hypothetical protein
MVARGATIHACSCGGQAEDDQPWPTMTITALQAGQSRHHLILLLRGLRVPHLIFFVKTNSNV